MVQNKPSKVAVGHLWQYGDGDPQPVRALETVRCGAHDYAIAVMGEAATVDERSERTTVMLTDAAWRCVGCVLPDGDRVRVGSTWQDQRPGSRTWHIDRVVERGFSGGTELGGYLAHGVLQYVTAAELKEFGYQRVAAPSGTFASRADIAKLYPTGWEQPFGPFAFGSYSNWPVSQPLTLGSYQDCYQALVDRVAADWAGAVLGEGVATGSKDSKAAPTLPDIYSARSGLSYNGVAMCGRVEGPDRAGRFKATLDLFKQGDADRYKAALGMPWTAGT